MKDDNCIFCKLANGDIPTNSIYEDDDFKVILDASPATKGHALILPKQHYANIFEIDDETLAKAAKLAKKIMTHEKDVLGCEGYNLVQNNGEVAGQTVFHFHMHLIPRYESDDNKNVIEWNHKEFTDDEMKKNLRRDEHVIAANSYTLSKKQKARICKCSSYPGFFFFIICNDALNRL